MWECSDSSGLWLKALVLSDLRSPWKSSGDPLKASSTTSSSVQLPGERCALGAQPGGPQGTALPFFPKKPESQIFNWMVPIWKCQQLTEKRWQR